MDRHGVAAVEREAQEVADALGERVPVARKRGDGEALAVVLRQLVLGVVAEHLHVAVEERVVLHLARHELVGRIRGEAIGRAKGEHHADLQVRPVVVGGDDRLGGREELVERRVCDVLRVRVDETGGHVRGRLDAVDLVEGKVVLHEAVKRREARRGVLDEAVHQVAAIPAVEAVGQAQRVLVVLERDERLDAVVLAGLEDVLVVGDALGVGLGVVSIREDAAPLEREAQAVEALLGAEADVLLVVMVEVGRDVAGIVDVGVVYQAGHGALGQVTLGRAEAQRRGAPGAVWHLPRDATAHRVAAVGHDVGGGEAGAALEHAALVLVGRGGAAPEEVLAKCHSYSPLCLPPSGTFPYTMQFRSLTPKLHCVLCNLGVRDRNCMRC